MNKQCRCSLALCVGLLAGVLFLLGGSARAQSAVVYVAPGGACGGAAPCYSSLQEAVDGAGEGDVVKVAEGTYTSLGMQVLRITKSITVVGGYSAADWGTSLPETRVTVLDARNITGRRGIVVQVSDDAPVWLEGLVVQRSQPWLSYDGGGIYIASGNVTIHKCILQDNAATGLAGGGGGGVFLETGSLTISESTIRNNTSLRSAGGIGMRDGTLLVTDSVIENNTAVDNGGGVLVDGAGATLLRNTIRGNSPMGVFVTAGAAVLTQNTIEDNTSDGNGGGISVDGYNPTSVTASYNVIRNNSAASGGGVGVTAGNASLYGNEVVGNTATSNGGGIAAWASGSQITLVGNRLAENTGGSLGGGAVYLGDGNLTLERNVILRNRAPGAPGGAIVIAAGRLVGMNDVIADNASRDEGIHLSGGTLVARHWTLANNGSFAVSATGGSASLTNTIVSSHTLAGYWGADVVADHTLFYKIITRCGNGATCGTYINGTPAFVDEEGGDYHIGSQSPAVDAGIDAGVHHDLDGEPRFGTPDLGADEYWAAGALRYAYVPLILQGAR